MTDKEALAIAVRALRWYANEKHYSEDDWGVRSIVKSPDYGNAGQKARNALDRISKGES